MRSSKTSAEDDGVTAAMAMAVRARTLVRFFFIGVVLVGSEEGNIREGT